MKIANTSTALAELSEEVIGNLRELRQAAEQGKWERISELSPAVVALMTRLQTQPKTIEAATENRRKLEEIQQMLQEAIGLCTSRMEQISPLLKEFKVTQATTEQP